MRTRVLLLRHAETAVPNVFHGAESDIGLGKRGQAQAAAVAPVIAAERPDVVISSAMRRAVDTATPIAAASGLSLQIEPNLHERRVGRLSGQPFDTDGIWPETLRHWVAGETSYAPEGAESFDDIRNRVEPVWQRLTETYAGQTLVVVAHGVVCKVLILSLARGWKVSDWHKLGPARNVAINELTGARNFWEALRIGELPPTVAAVQDD